MASKVVINGEIVRGTKGQYSGKVYVVVDRVTVFKEQGYPEMPDDYEPNQEYSDRRLAWREKQAKQAMKEGRYFLYTLKNKESTIKVWSYLLIGAEGKQPSFERVAVDELTKNNAIARKNKLEEDRMKRYKFMTNTPWNKYYRDYRDPDKYGKGPAGSNA